MFNQSKLALELETPWEPEAVTEERALHLKSGTHEVQVNLVESLAQRLQRLCVATEIGTEAALMADEVFRSVIVPWTKISSSAAGNRSGWVSEISDDNTPLEFSVTLSPEESEVRVLFEPQAEVPSLRSNREAGLAMHLQLAREYGADLTRFKLIEDLFLPEDMQGPFAVWSAVVFAKGKQPSFKAYFNTQAQGVGRAPVLVEQALGRLGLPRAWKSVTRSLARRGPHHDELKYFALDLNATSQARVKVYVRHHNTTPEDVEAAANAAPGSTSGDTLDFARAMGGGRAQFLERATFTCAAFVEGADQAPAAVTQYVPVCAYASDDAVVESRVAGYLAQHGADAAAYRRVLHAFANRPLNAGVGMQSWVALRRYRGVSRLTVYLGSESRAVFDRNAVPAATSSHMAFDSAEDVIARVSAYSLADHPLIARIAQQDPSGELLWLLITNTYEGTSRQFTSWLAAVTACVQDETARSLLARQPNEEMGTGDVAQAHSRLMHSFLQTLEPLRPSGLSELQLEPGRRLRTALARHYLATDPHEAMATLMMGEICAHQLIASVGQLLARHMGRLNASGFAWLTHHNEVEGDHAGESLMLARLVPKTPEAIAAVQRGAMGLHSALWESMNALYALWSPEGTAPAV